MVLHGNLQDMNQGLLMIDHHLVHLDQDALKKIRIHIITILVFSSDAKTD
jgi:hypothetical protein